MSEQAQALEAIVEMPRSIAEVVGRGADHEGFELAVAAHEQGPAEPEFLQSLHREQHHPRVIPPTDTIGSPLASSPVMVVDRGVNFEIGLNAESVEVVQPFTVTVISRGSSRSLKLETLNSAMRGKVRIGSRDGSLSFIGNATNKGTATHTYEQGGVTYSFEGVEETAYHPEKMDFRSYQSRNRVVFSENDAFASMWTVRVRSRTGSGSSSYIASGVRVRPGSQLAVTYRGWAGRVGKPTLWLDTGSNGTLDVRIPMRRR